MKKIVLTMLSSAIVALTFAQTVAEGIKDIYYQKYKSAKDVLQKAVTANPADPDANYWLGQVYINQDDLAGARGVYAKAMTATAQNPLIMVGMGHVEALEGKNTDARAHFDAALAATTNKKGGDVKILTAVGRANADGDSKTGDPVYGIDKLNIAAKLDPKNPEIQTLIGVSNVKRGPDYGGAAKTAYDQALALDPTYANAKLRTARIFQSQNNPTVFIPFLEQSVTADPKFAPGFLALYDYYSRRDVNKAKTYLDQYIALADKDCETDFFYADYQLQAGQRDAALAKAKEMEANCSSETFPKLNKLYAVIYERQGDSLQAKNYFERYISKEVPARLNADDYVSYAMILAKFPGNDATIDQNIELALTKDTSTANNSKILNDIATTLALDSNYAGELKYRTRANSIKPYKTATELYYWGLSALNAKNYVQADTIYGQYISLFPDQPQGYSFRVRAAKLADADTSKGTAIPAIDAYTRFLMNDTAKNKNTIIQNHGYKVYYYVNKLKDYQQALNSVNDILAIDPTNNYANGAKQQLEKLINARKNPPATTTPTTKPATTKPATKPATPAKKPGTGGR